MNKPVDPTPPQTDTVNRSRRFLRRFYIWSLWLLILIFWEPLLELMLHGLDIVIEFLELGVEDLLEMAFHLEGHSAQMYTAWTGLAAFTALAVFGYLWASRFIRARFRSWFYCRFRLMEWLRENWLPLTLLTSAYLATQFFF